MGYFTLVKANMKKQKEGFLGVALLLFIITVALCTVITIWNNSHSYIGEELTRLGYGDLTSWISITTDTEPLKDQIKAVQGVEQVKEQKFLYSKFKANGKESTSDAFLMEYDKEAYDYHIFQDDLSARGKNIKSISKGEIYVTPSFCSLYQVSIGDVVEFSVTQDKTKTFRVSGYFEDPLMGTTMMGMKSVLFCKKDIKELEAEIKQNGNQAIMVPGAMLHISKTSNVTSVPELQSKINKETDLGNYAIFSYSRDTIVQFMLILQEIFAGFLLAFVVVLLVVAMIVIGHNINSSLEQDYVNMGILKALGLTKGMLQKVQLLQYLLAVILGILMGLPVSYWVVQLFNKITVTTTGVLIPENLPMGICGLIFTVIVVAISGYIGLKLIKVGRISPIRAIRGGTNDVYFKSRLTTPIQQKGLGFWLAFRQVISGKKQYISACLVIVLLVFFVSLVGRINAWVGPNGKGIAESFNCSAYDLGVYSNSVSMKDIVKTMEEEASIKEEFLSDSRSIKIDGIDYLVNLISEPERYRVFEGRTCRYDNEVLLTEFVAKDLNVTIGDTVTITNGEKSAEYLVCGINHCANDMGANCSMNFDGFQRITDKDAKGFAFHSFILKDSAKKQKVIDHLKKQYGEEIQIDENTWSGIESVVAAIKGLEILMYIIVFVFIFVVTALTGSKILYKEKQDMGIYKSLGFTSLRIRVPFALRFGIISVLGSIFGILASSIFTDPMAKALLKFCGISDFSSHLNGVQMIWPALVVTVLFIAFSFFSSRKVKKVDPAILISE